MGRKATGQKKPTSIRLSAEGRRMLELMAGEHGITMSAWLEMTIRREAKRLKITLGGAPSGTPSGDGGSE